MRKDQVGVGIGVVSIKTDSPTIIVGRRYSAQITYTAGPSGISTGGALRFKLPGMKKERGDSGPISCSNPDVKCSCSNHVPEVNGKKGSEFFTNDYLFVIIEQGRLNEGDSITVRYGDNIALPGTAAPQWAQEWPVEVAVDVDGSRRAPGSGFYLVEDSPALTIVNDRAYRMEVFVPSYTSVDRCFRTTVRLLDQYNNLVEDYMGAVVLEAQTGGRRTILDEHRFQLHDRGIYAFENTCLSTAGVHRILALDEASGICARSNPTKTTLEKNEIRLFWGDTHCHSSISADTAAINAMVRRPADNYDYARNRASLDFCMVTDHIENQSKQEWEETRQAARAAYKPGEFVAFSGFEATYQPLRCDGDKNVYFFNDDEPWVNKGSTQDLYENLKRRQSKVMVIPHLHCQTNWERHDPELERVVEVYAHWGCGLSQDSDPPIIPGTPRRPESYVHYALEQGIKLGFIASADHSYGHPGDDFWWGLSNYNGGLAAVYSPALTRRDIWESLWSRQCYGTTRARILLEFEINGHVMGEEFVMGSDTREMAINVYGTSAIAAVEIVKNGRILRRFPGNRRIDLELTCHDDTSERGTDYYYVHVVQEDSEQAWSSPIWVNRPVAVSE